jgi:hypothetical protein
MHVWSEVNEEKVFTESLEMIEKELENIKKDSKSLRNNFFNLRQQIQYILI